jgi:hypothetical protein
MSYLRPPEYFLTRFTPRQELAWLAYKAGLDLVLPCGRRSGKTELDVEILIEDVEEYEKPCLYVAKTQKQARDIVWPKFRQKLKGNSNWKPKEASLEWCHASGAVIRLAGADLVAENQVGSAYRIIVCDEFALWKKPEIYSLVLAPMLVDFAGQVIFSSTKRGQNHFFRLHKRAISLPDKYFVQEMTMFDNTFLTDEGRQKIIQEYEGGELNPLYRQEVLNQYVIFEGMVFAINPEEYVENRWDPADLEHAFHFRGMDHGYNPDPTAAIWLAYNKHRGHWQVYQEYKRPKLLIKDHADAIKGLEPYSIVETYSDIDPQVIAEYEAVGLAMAHASKADKNARLLKLVTALKTGRLKIASNCTALLEEMASYVWDQDGNDHLIDSLAYGYIGAFIPQDKETYKPREVWESRHQEFEYQSFGD